MDFYLHVRVLFGMIVGLSVALAIFAVIYEIAYILERYWTMG
jgi:hypothetical protein